MGCAWDDLKTAPVLLQVVLLILSPSMAHTSPPVVYSDVHRHSGHCRHHRWRAGLQSSTADWSSTAVQVGVVQHRVHLDHVRPDTRILRPVIVHRQSWGSSRSLDKSAARVREPPAPTEVASGAASACCHSWRQMQMLENVGVEASSNSFTVVGVDVDW